MGGHGALTLGLKNPDKYCSISAFAPISNPMAVPWGQKAFKGYLGDDKSQWKQYDATELAKDYNGPERAILIDQGTGDNFLKEQLDPTAWDVVWITVLLFSVVQQGMSTLPCGLVSLNALFAEQSDTLDSASSARCMASYRLPS